MFKTIWKGIVSFFTITEKTGSKITRRYRHSSVPSSRVPGGYTQNYQDKAKDAELMRIQAKAVQETYEALVKLNIAAGYDGKEPIENAKVNLLDPLGIGKPNFDYILQNCGYTKDFMVDGERSYDPKLYPLITLAMNVYLTKVTDKADKLAIKLEG